MRTLTYQRLRTCRRRLVLSQSILISEEETAVHTADFQPEDVELTVDTFA